MTERVSRADVIRAFGAHVDALERFGLIADGDTWHLQIGNAYSVWALYVKRADAPGERRPNIGDDTLGTTAREARSTLIGRTRVIYDVFAELRTQRRWLEPRRPTTRERVEASIADEVTR